MCIFIYFFLFLFIFFTSLNLQVDILFSFFFIPVPLLVIFFRFCVFSFFEFDGSFFLFSLFFLKVLRHLVFPFFSAQHPPRLNFLFHLFPPALSSSFFVLFLFRFLFPFFLSTARGGVCCVSSCVSIFPERVKGWFILDQKRFLSRN